MLVGIGHAHVEPDKEVALNKPAAVAVISTGAVGET